MKLAVSFLCIKNDLGALHCLCDLKPVNVFFFVFLQDSTPASVYYVSNHWPHLSGPVGAILVPIYRYIDGL